MLLVGYITKPPLLLAFMDQYIFLFTVLLLCVLAVEVKNLLWNWIFFLNALEDITNFLNSALVIILKINLIQMTTSCSLIYI